MCPLFSKERTFVLVSRKVCGFLVNLNSLYSIAKSASRELAHSTMLSCFMRSVVEALNLSLLYCQVTNWLVWKYACHMQNRTLQSVYSRMPFDMYKFVKDSLVVSLPRVGNLYG